MVVYIDIVSSRCREHVKTVQCLWV